LYSVSHDGDIMQTGYMAHTFYTKH